MKLTLHEFSKFALIYVVLIFVSVNFRDSLVER